MICLPLHVEGYVAEHGFVSTETGATAIGRSFLDQTDRDEVCVTYLDPTGEPQFVMVAADD